MKKLLFIVLGLSLGNVLQAAEAKKDAQALSVYVKNRSAYVIIGDRAKVFDVSNPGAPVLISADEKPPKTKGSLSSKFIKGKYKYVADASGNSLKIYDNTTNTLVSITTLFE
jgi:hypothetical protein